MKKIFWLIVFFALEAEGQVFDTVVVDNKKTVVFFYEGKPFNTDILSFYTWMLSTEYIYDENDEPYRDCIFFVDMLTENYTLLLQNKAGFWERVWEFPEDEEQPPIKRRGDYFIVTIKHKSATLKKGKYLLGKDIAEKECTEHQGWVLTRIRRFKTV